MLGFAIIMSFMILTNLANIYISRKKKELIVMRINGFSVRQTVGYLLREIVATTALGIVLGIAAGAAMAYFILRSLEQSFVQFDRSISLPAWGLGAGITILFAVLVNWIVLRKVKTLKLTDVSE